MTWVELPTLRSAKRKIFADDVNPLKRRLVATLHDQHYHDGVNWQDCDENFEDDDLPGFVHRVNKVRHAIHADANGRRRWYPRRNHPDEYVEFGRVQYFTTSWQNLNLGAPTRTGNSLLWSTANFDLRVTNTWRKIKLEAVLKTEAAKRRLRWAVSLTGLTWDNWRLISQSDGQVVGYIDKPKAWDANGSEENPNVNITNSYSGGYVEFGGDLSAATLPVVIDPTFTDGPSGDTDTAKDTGLLSGSATNNYGTYNRLQSGGLMTGLIEFDVSSIAAGSTCDSATAYFYQSSTGQAGTITLYSIASGNAAWIEGTQNGAQAGAGEPCWNALAADGSGGVTTAWAGSAGCATSGTDYEADVIGSFNVATNDATGTEYSTLLTATRVDDWFGSPNTNYGIRVKDSTNIGRIASSDHATTGYRPKLVVDYTEAGGGCDVTIDTEDTSSSSGSTNTGGVTTTTTTTRTIYIETCVDQVP